MPEKEHDHDDTGNAMLATELERSRIANQNRTDLVSMLVHELRTALSGVKWSVDILLDQDLGPLNDGQRALLKRMMLADDRMRSIVDDILTLNRSTDSSAGYSFSPVDIVAVVDEIIFDLSYEAKARGVEVLFVKPSDPVIVQGDKLKLRGAFQNLIENAIKYSLRDNSVHVDISTTTTDAQITIRDSGIGIPANEKDRIFDKFFRASNA
ncbi:MAG TPA: HAMP domain-containing sensor histidine kinase, partial [Candidatus Paceibacterota bacterium]|nr:HAMP domain-containing sensor histidine kinase [Candidatus Paceibacterota bacterium]